MSVFGYIQKANESIGYDYNDKEEEVQLRELQ